jgi:Ca-activated chloride channel homolog
VFDVDLSQFHFMRPWWFAALVPALLLAWRYLQTRQAHSQWERNVDPALLAVLLDKGAGGGQRWLAPALIAGLVLCVGALAGPTWERLPQPVEQRSDAVVVVLDLSLPMLAEDVAPSRIVRARHKVADILRERTEGHTGLVVFAGDAHVVTPMTDDVATIENLLPHLAPDLMPLPGSNPAMGVQLARQLLNNAGATQGRIILITSGVVDIDAVARLASRQFPVSVLGIGTRDGAPIPLDGAGQAGRLLRDERGGVVFTRLDGQSLQELARRAHGRFTEMTTTDADVQMLLDTALPQTGESTRIEREYDAWVDRGYVLLLLLLPLALLGFRRGAMICLCLVAVLPTDATASTWSGLWQTPDRRAVEALEHEPERAAQLFTRKEWRGIAHYRHGDYTAAEQAFAHDATARGHYNRGNALAWQGRIEEAIAAYDVALAIEPAHDDARFNRDLLKEILDQQEESANADDGMPQSGGDPADRNEDGSSMEPMPGFAMPDDSPGSGDPENDAAAAMHAQIERERDARERMTEQEVQQLEEEHALQQWLRRVPDDPGGLLRRKFHQETNRRLREGDLSPRQEPGW